ncbi:MAG: sigma 54-interacting transcriptional regulator [Myxococcales bacterium]|nr:sigma 54-interacting transcriptional regulator [Myxococcales bacterium]
MPALLLLTGPSAGLRLEVKEEAVLGRSPSCEIPLEDGKVSRRHARIFLKEGQARIVDLGSRNGTAVNGERIEGEAILLPGDRVQVGDSTVLYEPPAKASLQDREAGEVHTFPVEEVLPAVGPVAALYSAGVGLLSATSEAMVLRRAAEELGRSVNADRAAALLGGMEGLLTAAVVGAEAVEVPRSMVRAALERKETGRAEGVLCAPLAASGGLPFGILYADRTEPFGAEEQKVAAALGRLAGEAFAAVRSRTEREAPQVMLVGSSRQFRKTVEQARRAAAGAEAVVLHGEAGTGKSLAAHYIHGRSSRGLGPLLSVDCRQGPLAVEEELFGRQSGPGVPPLSSALLRSDGGTLVLAHVEMLQRSTAERLARLLARKMAPARQGGEEPVDVRVIASASAPLQLLAAKGEIDGELAKALSGTEIELLPLRERRTDVPALLELFAARATRPLRREPPTLSPDARRMLVDYAWPGNVRELRLLAERLAVLYAGAEVSALKLPPEVQEGSAAAGPKTLSQLIGRLERDAISEALREARGKKIRAAAILGISRPTLDKKIEDYRLTVEKIRKA